MKKSLIIPILKGLDCETLKSRLAMILGAIDDKPMQEEIIQELVEGVPCAETSVPKTDELLKTLQKMYEYKNIQDVVRIEIASLQSKVFFKRKEERWYPTKEAAEEAMRNPNARGGSYYRQSEDFPYKAEFLTEDYLTFQTSELLELGVKAVLV